MKSVYILLFINWLYCFACFAQTNKIPEYASILSHYIQYPSEQYKEKKAGLFFMEECKKRGLYAEVLTNEDTAFNFVASLYPLSLGKPNIIFLNHIDIVLPGDTTLWTHPPYSGDIIDNYVWGRGSIDNKGMAVAELFAMVKFVELAKEKNLNYNFSILSVSGEETDGYTGARQIAERFLQKLNPCLILGEGGSGVKGIVHSNPEKIVFGISTTEKSKLILNLEMNLVSSGHGSVPPKEYAMKEMIFALEKLLKRKPKIVYNKISVRALKVLGKEEKGIRGFVQSHFTFIFFRPLVKREIKKDPILISFFSNTSTFIDLKIPETSDNQISQIVTATFDCRLMPGANKEKFIKNIRKSLKDSRVNVNVLYQVNSAARTNNPVYFHHLKTAIENVFPKSIVLEMIFPATTDNNIFRAKGIPVLGIFPACFEEDELKSIHNINERIHIQRLTTAISVYEKFIQSLISEQRITLNDSH